MYNRDCTKITLGVLDYLQKLGYKKEYIENKIRLIEIFIVNDIKENVEEKNKEDVIEIALSNKKYSYSKILLKKENDEYYIYRAKIFIYNRLNSKQFRQVVIYEILRLISTKLTNKTKGKQFLNVGIERKYCIESDINIIKKLKEVEIKNINEGILTYITYIIYQKLYQGKADTKIMQYDIYSKFIEKIILQKESQEDIIDIYLKNEYYKFFIDLDKNYNKVKSIGKEIYITKIGTIFAKYKLYTMKL